MKDYEITALNQRITIQKREVTKDKACNEVEVWQDYYSCYAGVLNTKTNVEVQNAEQQNKQQVTFIARSCKKLEALICNAKDYSVVFKGYRFNIFTADNFGYTHDKFKLIVVSENE